MKIAPFIAIGLIVTTACSDNEKCSPTIEIDNNRPIFYTDENIEISGKASSDERNLKYIKIEYNGESVYEQNDINEQNAQFNFDTTFNRTGEFPFVLIVADNENLKSYENIICKVQSVEKPSITFAKTGVYQDTSLAANSNFKFDVVIKKGLRNIDSIFVAKDSLQNIIFDKSIATEVDSLQESIQLTNSDIGQHSYTIIVSDDHQNKSTKTNNILFQ